MRSQPFSSGSLNNNPVQLVRLTVNQAQKRGPIVRGETASLGSGDYTNLYRLPIAMHYVLGPPAKMGVGTEE
jgi:hypothetical protein